MEFGCSCRLCNPTTPLDRAVSSDGCSPLPCVEDDGAEVEGAEGLEEGKLEGGGPSPPVLTPPIGPGAPPIGPGAPPIGVGMPPEGMEAGFPISIAAGPILGGGPTAWIPAFSGSSLPCLSAILSKEIPSVDWALPLARDVASVTWPNTLEPRGITIPFAVRNSAVVLATTGSPAFSFLEFSDFANSTAITPSCAESRLAADDCCCAAEADWAEGTTGTRLADRSGSRHRQTAIRDTTATGIRRFILSSAGTGRPPCCKPLAGPPHNIEIHLMPHKWHRMLPYWQT